MIWWYNGEGSCAGTNTLLKPFSEDCLEVDNDTANANSVVDMQKEKRSLTGTFAFASY